jgi:hypothetical protein
METEIITTKIKRSSLKQLKIVAALTGERMTDVLERLIAAELERLQKGPQDEGHKGIQDGTRPNA